MRVARRRTSLISDSEWLPLTRRVSKQPTRFAVTSLATGSKSSTGGRIPQQMLRLDREKIDGFEEAAFTSVKTQIDGALQSADAVVLSDYGKGLLTEDLCQHIIIRARDRSIPVLVDPKQRDFTRYRGATTI